MEGSEYTYTNSEGAGDEKAGEHGGNGDVWCW